LIILGIDPGSRITGYGIIRLEGNQTYYIESGCLKITAENVAMRLQQIADGMKEVILRYQPAEVAIEQIFMHQNPNSALKLGQARGAALAVLAMPVAEYTARQVKQAIVGYGAAKKEQIQHMVTRLLSIKHVLQADAADALAVALCHAHSRSSLVKMGVKATRKKRSSWRDFKVNE
jgi:crossover junction endodeoxyribonuclease RuvC